MKLTVINSNSSGNAYVIQNESEALLIECGMKFSLIKEALDFNLSKVAGCIVTHRDQDHSKFMNDYLDAGIDLYSSQDCFEGLNIKHHRAHPMAEKQIRIIGNFRVMPFQVKHDVPCYGYLIDHVETGRVCFITDSHYVPFTFKGLNNILIEANYDIDIVDQNLMEGKGNVYVRNRVLNSHMEFQQTKAFLQANDLSAVNNIVLIHLSDSGSDEARFVKEIHEQTGKTVYAAKKGLEIEFNKQPF